MRVVVCISTLFSDWINIPLSFNEVAKQALNSNSQSSSVHSSLLVKNTLSNNVIKKCFIQTAITLPGSPDPGVSRGWVPVFLSDILWVQLGDKCDHCNNLWWECDVFIGHQLGYKEGALNISCLGSAKLKASATHWTRPSRRHKFRCQMHNAESEIFRKMWLR